MVIYRSKLHATLKRKYQLMPTLKWLRLLMNHIPDKHEHLLRYYGNYSNHSRGARKQAENDNDMPAPLLIDEPTVDARRNANWARPIRRCTRSSRRVRADEPVHPKSRQCRALQERGLRRDCLGRNSSRQGERHPLSGGSQYLAPNPWRRNPRGPE